MSEDNARIVSPFAFTTGGSGDFRPQVIKVDKDPENVKDRDDLGVSVETPKTDPKPTKITDTKGEQAPEITEAAGDPKDSSVQEPVVSLQVVPTVDEFDKQLAQAASVPVGTDSQNDLEDTSEIQKKTAPPTLAERAKSAKTE